MAGLRCAANVEVESAAEPRPLGQIILPLLGLVLGIQLLHEIIESMPLSGGSNGGYTDGIGDKAG